MSVFVRHPVDNPRITQPFGAPNDWESPPWHKGIDYGADKGTPIYAPCDGFVVWASFDVFKHGNTWEMIPGSGNSGGCVILQPPAPHTSLQTSFSHMSEIVVKPGQWVTAGTMIGRVGNTGFSFGAHLHWEAFIDYAEGVYPAGTFYGRVNPLDYFSTSTVVPLGTGGKGSNTPQEEDSPMSQAEVNQIQAMHDVTRQYIADLTQKQHDVTRTHLVNTTQAQHDVTRAHIIGSVSGATQAQADVTRQFLSDRIKEGAKPDEVADSVIAALGTDLAEEVVTALINRLKETTK